MKLECGDINNFNVKVTGNEKRGLNFCLVTAFSNLSKDEANEVTKELTNCENWDVPCKKEVADIIFFTLCNNMNKNKNVLLKSFVQARNAFYDTENDYRKIEKEEANPRVRFETVEKEFNCFYPGTNFTLLVPVTFFYKKGTKISLRKYNFTSFGKCRINGEEYQVPNSILLKFFPDIALSKTSVSSTDKISQYITITFEAVYELLTYLGYSILKDEEEFTIPSMSKIVNDKLFVNPNWGGITCEHLYQKKNDNNWILLPKANYVITNLNGVKIFIK